MPTRPVAWLAAAFVSNALVQVAVTLARPVSTYRLLAVGADATAVGVVAAAFALPPLLLAARLGRWSDRSHPGLMLIVSVVLASSATLLARAATPWLARRMARVRLVVVSTVVSAACVALLPLGGAPVLLAALMAALGFLLALTQTITMVWVVALVPADSRGSALGLRLAGNRLGQVAVPGFAGLLVGAASISPVFYLLGAVLVGSAVVVAQSTSPEF